MPLVDLACAVHVHSTYSDGTATVPELIADAARSGLDALLLTDHDTLGAQEEGWEGWHDGMLLLVGHEVSPKGGHLLVFGAPAVIPHAGRTEEEILADADAAGAITFAAHPFSAGSRISKTIVPPHPWRRRDLTTGVEVWSLFTDAAEHWRSLRQAVAFLADPQGAVVGPPPGNLAAWDELTRRRRTVAIGGLDAHQTGFRIGGSVRTPVPNRLAFSLLRTHILVASPPGGELNRDRALVYEALAAGRCYLAMDSLAPSRGFRFAASRGSATVEMGGEAVGSGWDLQVRVPRSAHLVLKCDGRAVAATTGGDLLASAEAPGAYRVEAHLAARSRVRTWILSNPIYVRG